MHCTVLEQQILRQLTDDTQWDMIAEIKARGIDGALDFTETDGVPLTAVEAEMLAECTDDARGRLMRAAATQRLGPPGVPDRLESDVPLITDIGFDRQDLERAIALYGEAIDGPADDIQTDGGYMDVESRPAG